MSTDEQSQMVDDISSIIMRGRYGRSGVGRPSDNPLDLRDARRIVEYVTARDARVRRDAAREALDRYAAAEEDSFLSLHAKDAPIAAAQCTHAATTAREYRDTHYPEETP